MPTTPPSHPTPRPGFPSSGMPELDAALHSNTPQFDLNDLDEEQLRAVTAPRGPVAIIAGAGTGKTRTITHRIAHLVSNGFVNPDQVLAVTFTRRAANEMRERLVAMGAPRVQARTFHSAALRQLSYFWPAYGGNVAWQILENKFGLIARVARRHGADTDTSTLRDLLGEIEWAKSSLVLPEEYPGRVDSDRRDCPVDLVTFVRIFKDYEHTKSSNAETMLLDFDDVLLHMAGAIESNLGIAEEFRSRYRSFVVDEYQDVTPLQQRVLDAWLGPRDDLTVVGDANQTIYSFNGATPSYLLDFSRRFPEAVTVRLHRDYRSTPQVVDLANTVIGQATGRIAGTRLTLEGQQPPGPEPVMLECSDEESEAAAVARDINRLIDSGVEAADIAVLYRINAQSEAYEYALEQAGIGYQVKGGVGFYQRPEVQQGLSAIARTATRHKPEPADVPRAVRAALRAIGLTPEEPQGMEERQRWQSLTALYDLVEDLCTTADNTLSIEAVLAALKERASSATPPRVQGVTLASLHAAKGLEWDAVYLVGLNEGTLPIRHALKGRGADEAIEEERRLFYVGITRARRHLHLSWSRARKAGSSSSRQRTRFLDGIAPEEAPAASSTTRRRKKTSGATACTTCNGALSTKEEKIIGLCATHAPSIDMAILTDLRNWRTVEAGEKGVPAYNVFSDATLLAIAEAHPTTPQDLLSVSGVGPGKLAAYGDTVLAIVANYAS